MKKVTFAFLGMAGFVNLFGAAGDAFNQWPFTQAGSPFADWSQSWTNFNRQMADLAALKDTLPAAARPELEEALEAAEDLADASKNIEAFSTGVAMVDGKVYLNGKPIKATGSKMALINGVLFLDDKEVDPVTGDFKAGSSARTPASVSRTVRSTTTRFSSRSKAGARSTARR